MPVPVTDPSPRQLVRWLMTAAHLINRANARWVEACRERGLSPPGGETLVTRDGFHSGVYLRAFPGEPYPALGGAVRALAVLFAEDPARVKAAARQYLTEAVEVRTEVPLIHWTEGQK